MDAKLQGKSAIITGGTSGIGLGIAHALADEGVRLAVARCNPDPQAIEELRGRGVEVVARRAPASSAAPSSAPAPSCARECISAATATAPSGGLLWGLAQIGVPNPSPAKATLERRGDGEDFAAATAAGDAHEHDR